MEWVSKIVNGTKADIARFAFLVVVYAFRHDDSNVIFCGGSYLGGGNVLTAAHCVYGKEQATVLFDQSLLDYDSILDKPDGLPCDQLFIHPDFDPASLTHDLAILHFSSYFDETHQHSFIKIPPLPVLNHLERPQTNLTIAGYGKYHYSDKAMVHVLTKGNVKIMEKRYDFPYLKVDESMIVAGDERIEDGHFHPNNEEFMDTCQGDSGGPLFLTGNPPLLVGVTSWGIGCGYHQYPGVYSRVSTSFEWIKNVTGLPM